MLRNLNVKIVDAEGNPVEFATGATDPTGRPMTEQLTLLHRVLMALGQDAQGEKAPGNKELNGLYQVEKWELALRLRPFLGKDEQVELSDRDVEIIKASCEAKKFSTFIMAPLLSILTAK